jgi:RND family efflux transporter MFP subunit
VDIAPNRSSPATGDARAVQASGRYHGSLRTARLPALLAVLVSFAPAGFAQNGDAPVRVTRAESRAFHSEVRLPASVEATITSIVAGEVEGLIEELPVERGQAVKTGDLLARLRTRPLELDRAAVEAELAETLARQNLAERELRRARELFDAKVIAQDALDAKLYEFEAWQGRDRVLRARIERIEEDMARSVVRAPFDGVVVEKRAEAGEWLAKGGAVVELLSKQGLEVNVDVPERYLSRFRPGARVSVAIDALGGRRLSATVRTIIPRSDPASRTFPVKLTLADAAGALPGMMAEAVFPGGDRDTRTIVPKDALVLQGAQQVVFVVTGEGTVRPAPVRAGPAIGQWVAVEGPVQPGDLVVTRGNERLRPGQPVSAQELEYPLP